MPSMTSWKILAIPCSPRVIGFGRRDRYSTENSGTISPRRLELIYISNQKIAGNARKVKRRSLIVETCFISVSDIAICQDNVPQDVPAHWSHFIASDTGKRTSFLLYTVFLQLLHVPSLITLTVNHLGLLSLILSVSNMTGVNLISYLLSSLFTLLFS